MRRYLFQSILLIILILAMVETWGDTSKTIMYTIAFISLISLMMLRGKDTNGNN